MVSNLLPFSRSWHFQSRPNCPQARYFFGWWQLLCVAYIAVMLWRKSLPLVFLALVAVLNIFAIDGFPLDYFNTRYLYLSMMVTAILAALLLESARRLAPGRALLTVESLWLFQQLSSWEAQRVGEAAAELAEHTRQTRVHSATFPGCTVLSGGHTSLFHSILDDFSQGLLKDCFLFDMEVRSRWTPSKTGRPVDWRAHQAAFVCTILMPPASV